ncbi:MAG: hypothetical protein GEV07_23900 [Streptosporangiales bacterium]|nr:hypothetical protein [Streptosporangiales bacterium]
MFDWHDGGPPGGAQWPRDSPTGSCRFPGCRRPARTVVAPAGPPLCRRHRLLLSFGGWRVVRAPDGSYAWTSPDGVRYHRRPSGGESED